MSGHPLLLTLDFSVSLCTDSQELAERACGRCVFSTHMAYLSRNTSCKWVLYEATQMILDTRRHSISHNCMSKSQKRDSYNNVISSDAGSRNMHQRIHFTWTRTNYPILILTFLYSRTHSTQCYFPSGQTYLKTHTALPHWHDNLRGEIFHMWH